MKTLIRLCVIGAVTMAVLTAAGLLYVRSTGLVARAEILRAPVDPRPLQALQALP